VKNGYFDDRNIRWYTLEGFDNLAYHVCDVDERLRSVDGEPHTEGGGDIDVIALFSNRGIADNGVVYEILDENLNVVVTFGIPEFKALLDAQRQSEAA
jgi:hypothetical protein